MNPIVVVVVPPVGGSFSTTYGLIVPNNPSLSGAQLDVQWVDYEGTGFNFGTSSSARLTVGY